MSPDTFAALLGLCYLGACTLALHPLLHATANARVPRAVLGVLLAGFTLATHPMTYAAGNQVYSPVLAFLAVQAALTMLDWVFVEPASRQPSVFEVLAAHLQHSMAGVRKARQRKAQQQQQADRAGGVKPEAAAAAEARSRVSCPWVLSVLAAAAAVLRVSLFYDAAFYLLCTATHYCDPASSPAALHCSTEGVRQVGESGGGLVQQAAAYLRQCLPALLAGLSMGLQLNLVYTWVVLLLSVAAFATAAPVLRAAAGQCI